MRPLAPEKSLSSQCGTSVASLGPSMLNISCR